MMASHRTASDVRGDRQFARRRRFAALALCAPLAALGGCQTFYRDQVDVPGTNQRLIVGSSTVLFGPFAAVWVLEDGKVTRVKVVKE